MPDELDVDLRTGLAGLVGNGFSSRCRAWPHGDGIRKPCGGCFQHFSTLKHWSHWKLVPFYGAPSKIGNKIGWLYGLNRWLVASWYLSSGFKQIQTRQLKLNLETATKKKHCLGYLQNCHRILQKSPAFIIIISSSSHPQMATFRSQIRGATDGEDRFLAKAGLGAGQEICWWPLSQIGIEDKHR